MLRRSQKFTLALITVLAVLLPLNNMTPQVSASRSADALAGGTLVTWGYSGPIGNTGDGRPPDFSTPTVAKGVGGNGSLDNVVAADAGINHAVALRTDGTVVQDSSPDRYQPIKGIGGMGTLTNVIAIASGDFHVLALRADGTVVAWGLNSQGEFGNGAIGPTNSLTSPPVLVRGIGGNGTLNDVVAIAAGFTYSVALRKDGTVVAWGSNRAGQLGDGSITNRLVPVQVKGIGGNGTLTNVKGIAAGSNSAAAVRHDGTVVTWGANSLGELGRTTSETCPVSASQEPCGRTPQTVSDIGGNGTLSGVTNVDIGDSHMAALRSDGTVVTWGTNTNGELGDGSTTARNGPVAVIEGSGGGSLRGITSVAVGSSQTFALRADGSAVAWGNNGRGALSVPVTTPNYSTTPVTVRGVGGAGTLTTIAMLGGGPTLGLAIVAVTTPPSGTTPCAGGAAFPQTGFCVRGRFLAQWQARGGLAINGYPLGEEFRERLADGNEYTVQYFERVRMEYHPENADPQYQILLGAFGRQLHPADPPVDAIPGALYFGETGHNVTRAEFADYWNANGGLAQFGFPISEEIDETIDGQTYRVQYFERARFEWHPENPAGQQVLLGQFGRQVCGDRCR